MGEQSDELAGLKKLLAALTDKDPHSRMTVSINGQDVTKNWVASLDWEIKVLERRLSELKNPHA